MYSEKNPTGSFYYKTPYRIFFCSKINFIQGIEKKYLAKLIYKVPKKKSFYTQFI